MKTPEEEMDLILFRRGRWATETGKIMEANYDGRVDDLRRWRLEMLEDQRREAEKELYSGFWGFITKHERAFWARVKAVLGF